MHRITFVVDLFKGPEEMAVSHAALKAMLVALTLIDVAELKANPQLPNLYESGVRYEEEPQGQEDWQDVLTCLRLKIADCEDLSAWRAAELQVRHGIMAWPTFNYRVRPGGGFLYHIQVRLPDGRIEDPSRALGMR
jgi:hypothetical protein